MRGNNYQAKDGAEQQYNKQIARGITSLRHLRNMRPFGMAR
jgi:hypothetical protein